MLVCNYCGRNFKNEFNTCPGCGSTTFNRVSDFGEKVIKKPPEGGYVINVDNFEKSKKMANIVKWIGWGLLIFMITFDLPFLLGGILAGQEDLLFGLTFSITSLVVTIPFVIISIVLISISKSMKKKAQENILRVKKLAKEGVLVKNMPYKLVSSGTVINNQPIYCIQVEYENSSGQKIPLKSEPRYNNKLSNKNGTVDLLIDPDDYSNYYIDLEIY